MATFVSYARQDHEAVDELKVDLERLGREVWIDEKLHGGQEWWDEILAAIRSCELFVWTVSPASVKSTACKAELTYASDLGRSVLPIMIKPVAIGLTPQRVANAQIVDYTTRDRDQVIKLAGDLQAVQLPPPLPPTLPEPPPVPITYLEQFANQVTTPTQMSIADQRAFLDYLRPLATSTEDPDETEAVYDLLRRLRSRPEVTYETATAIDKLLERPPEPDPPKSRRKFETTEFPMPVQPSQRSQSPPPPPPHGFPSSPSSPQAAVSPTAPAASGTAWSTAAVSPTAPAASGTAWSKVTVALLLVATLFSAGVVGIAAGLIGRSNPANRSQASTVLWVGLGWFLLLVLTAVNQWSETSS
jgi:TIR domain